MEGGREGGRVGGTEGRREGRMEGGTDGGARCGGREGNREALMLETLVLHMNKLKGYHEKRVRKTLTQTRTKTPMRIYQERQNYGVYIHFYPK